MPLFCFFQGQDGGCTTCFFGVGDGVSVVAVSASGELSAARHFSLPGAQEDSSLISLALSADNSFLCGVYSNKAVVCWDVETGNVTGQAVVHKKPTALTCSSMNLPQEGGDCTHANFALVSDKGGEVWAYPIPSLSVTCKLVGHTSSVITDMTLSPDKNKIVTSDRDEKIRLTSFPDTSTVFGYCLGHTDVVTSVAFLPELSQPFLVSAGWDHRICLWNTASDECKQVDSITLQDSPIPDACAKGDDNGADKVYDETKAGNFPFSIVASRSDCVNISDTAMFAMLFWDKPEISLCRVNQEDSNAHFVRVDDDAKSALITLNLPAPPVDCFFVNGDKGDDERLLLVLLPAPHYFATFLTSGEEVKEGTWSTVARHFSEIASKHELDLKQRLVFTDESLQEMKKHSLDRPYANAPKKKGKNKHTNEETTNVIIK